MFLWQESTIVPSVAHWLHPAHQRTCVEHIFHLCSFFSFFLSKILSLSTVPGIFPCHRLGQLVLIFLYAFISETGIKLASPRVEKNKRQFFICFFNFLHTMYFDHILCPHQLHLGFSTSLLIQIYDLYLLPLYLSENYRIIQNKQKIKEKISKQTKKKQTKNMDSILFWTTTHWHGTCPGIWLIHLVTFHQKKNLFFLFQRVPFANNLLVLGVILHIYFTLC